MSFVDPAPSAIGLDINDYSLKLVQLKKIGKKITLRAHGVLTIPNGLIKEGEIKDETELAALIEKLYRNHQGVKHLNHEVIAVLPETKTFLKNIIVDLPAEEELIAEIIIKEAEKQLPYELAEIYLDWQILDKTESGQTNVIIGAAPKKTVDSYLRTLQKANLIPLALEIEAVAVARALIKEKIQAKEARVIIDFGATRSGLAIFDKGAIQTTISLPISGNKITETIMNTLKLDWQQAEKAKVVCGLDKNKCSGALAEILDDNFEELAQKIRQSVQFYYDHYPNPSQVKQIIICGGSANFSEIDKKITEKSGIPTIVGDPWINVALDQQKALLPPTQSLTLTTAIGLALRGINLENV